MRINSTDMAVYTAMVVTGIGFHLLLSAGFSMNRWLSMVLSMPLGAVSVMLLLCIVYRFQKPR